MPPAQHPSRVPSLRGVILVAAIYAGFAGLGLLFALVGSNVSPYWPAAGAGVALLWRWGLGLWPGIAIGSLVGNIAWSHVDPGMSLAIAAGSTLGIVTTAGLLRHLRCPTGLDEPSAPVMLLLSATIGCAISALFGSLAVVRDGSYGSAGHFDVWWTWWSGDLTGVISTAPAFAILGRIRLDGRRLESAALVASLAGACLVAMFASPALQRDLSPWAFVLFPPLLWAAVRFGPGGAALAIAISAGATATMTASGLGAFADFSSGNIAHLPFQAFTIAAALTVLVLAAYAASQTRAQLALGDSERRYRLVADHARDVICLHAVDGTYQWVSPSAATVLGHRPEALIGTHPRDLIHPEDAARLPPGGLPSTVAELRFRKPDGGWLWMETAPQPVHDDQGRIIAVQTTSRDISSRKADAERLEQVQRAAALAERMASIGTLAGGVAHEFNNLNAVVMGNVELALRRSGLPEETRRRLEQIREAVGREQGVVDALLAFSRQDRGTAEITDLRSIVTTTVALARRTLRQRRVQLLVSLPEQPICATVPTGALGQVLLNLLLNAADAVDRRDDPRVQVSLALHDGRARLRVEDNGIGIPPALMPRIFEPFFSTKGEHAAPNAGQPWLRGTGLGLAVCRTLVEQLDGTIAASSVPDRGTTFTVTIPISDTPADARPSPALTTPCARILVVDDEAEIRRILCEQLAAAGHIAIEAADGAQAIAHLASEDIDLVMLDWSMPGLDGEGFLRHVELHPERRWPPVLVISGWTGGGSGLDRWRREIVGQLRKPFRFEQVKAEIERVLGGRTTEDDSSGG